MSLRMSSVAFMFTQVQMKIVLQLWLCILWLSELYDVLGEQKSAEERHG